MRLLAGVLLLLAILAIKLALVAGANWAAGEPRGHCRDFSMDDCSVHLWDGSAVRSAAEEILEKSGLTRGR